MSNKWKNVRKIRIVFSNCCHFENMYMILFIRVRARITSLFIISVSSKPHMHGAEGINAAETELLDRFGHVQTLNRKGAMGKNRKSEGIRFVLWLLTNWKSNGGRSENLPQLVLR